MHCQELLHSLTENHVRFRYRFAPISLVDLWYARHLCRRVYIVLVVRTSPAESEKNHSQYGEPVNVEAVALCCCFNTRQHCNRGAISRRHNDNRVEI